MGRLDGKVAVVTGSSSGIGEATAWLFAREGAKVVMGARRVERGQTMEKKMREEGLEATYVETDLMFTADCNNLIDMAVRTYGRIDILANIAGITGGKRCFLHETDDEDRDRVFRVNLYSIIDLCHAAIPHMLDQKSGSIVNISSVAALVACPTGSLYSAAKGAVRMLSVTMAHEYGKDGIRVNCICPGLTRSEMTANFKDEGGEQYEKILAGMPVGRIGDPEEIAKGILFFASDDGSFACGVVLPLDGGETIA